MKLHKLAFAILLTETAFAYSACSSIKSQPPSNSSSDDIGLSAVERLSIGKTTTSQVQSEFGGPGKVLPAAGNQDLWIYFKNYGGQQFQRLNLAFDHESGILKSATWLPSQSDPLHEQQAALSHFNSANFETKDIGWIARHYYSDETVYEDPKSGVSLLVNKTPKTVSAISFGQPSQSPVAKGD